MTDIDKLITPELRDAWGKLRSDCSYILYGECRTIGCMKRDPRGCWVKPFEFAGCRELIATDAIRDLYAALLESEFRGEHSCFSVAAIAHRAGFGPCDLGRTCLDPRHNYQWPQWQAEAERRLEAK